MKKLSLLVPFLLAVVTAMAQDSVTVNKILINGYIKDMQTVNLDSSFKNITWANLIHNRLNLKWKPSPKFTGVTEIRSRLFYSKVSNMPARAIAVRSENEYLDMQRIWINRPEFAFTSNIERLYFDYRSDKLDVRIGRQRVNWGLTTTWNPNDIFNSYNFLDFDYEERPGIDGAKLRYMLGNTSNLEFAYARTRGLNGNIGALKLGFNKWNYDFQLISGVYYNKPTIGGGWNGYFGDAGFKGELQYFFSGKDSTGHLNLTLESDYKFAKEWYVDLAFLYNNYGLSKPIGEPGLIDLDLSPKNLMPTKWNMILTVTKEFSPRLSANATFLYSPGTNLLIFFPLVKYNLLTNLDIDLIWQSFYAEVHNNFQSLHNTGFLRARLSF